MLLLGMFLGLNAQLIHHVDATAESTENQNDKVDRVKTPAQIECITPDGRRSAIAKVPTVDPCAPASILDENTISCPLREGETTFIIPLPKNALRDGLTFVNENAAACGEFKIAVSNSHLPADSPKWTEVDGIIPFAHKRLFNLSMLGVQTRFVRLSFRVESMPENGDRDVAGRSRIARGSTPADVINFKLQGQLRNHLAGYGSVSVAQLPWRLNE
jgi:hypothetical protein